ncbi:MAG: hypothetical protein U5K84_12070 [Alkalibacterium sp.]|nr:hypothetical protein [Alkalibacterium sp.]
MEVLTALVIIASLIIFSIEGTGMIKAYRQEYDSKFITLYRGWNVAAMFKEKEITDDRISTLLIINNMVNVLLLVILLYLYFSNMFFQDYSIWIALSFPLTTFIMRRVTDWRIRKVIDE